MVENLRLGFIVLFEINSNIVIISMDFIMMDNLDGSVIKSLNIVGD